MAAITRSTMRRRCSPTVLQEQIVQQVRIEHINQAQDEECWISDLKTYLIGDIAMLNARGKDLRPIRTGIRSRPKWTLFFCPWAAAQSEGRGECVRLLIPKLL